MNPKRNLLIGIMLGVLIGWALGFLRLPYIEKNFSFWVGFTICLVIILFVIVLLFVWNKNFLLIRLIGKGPTTEGSKNVVLTYTLIWIMVAAFIVFGGMISSLMIFKQNELFMTQAQKQNKRILEMSELVESARKSNLAFLMNKLLDNIHDELKNQPNRMLSDSTIARIAWWSNSFFMPYRYFEGDSLRKTELSPERGQLLLALSVMNMDSSSFARIKLDVPFSGADLSGADLRGAELSGVDLKGANLKDADLSGANLSGADLKGAILWGANLNKANLSGADLKRADLSWADMNGVDLKLANLNGVNLTSAQLIKADLRGASFQWAELGGAMLNEANLAGVDLEGTRFIKAILNKANLTEANLKRVNLSGANLIGAELTKADVGKKWLEDFNEWRIIGAEEIERNYKVLSDSLDKWENPVYRLKKIKD